MAFYGALVFNFDPIAELQFTALLKLQRSCRAGFGIFGVEGQSLDSRI